MDFDICIYALPAAISKVIRGGLRAGPARAARAFSPLSKAENDQRLAELAPGADELRLRRRDAGG